MWFMRSKETEAIKLFANTYLAVCGSCVDELDTSAEQEGVMDKIYMHDMYFRGYLQKR